VPATIACWVKFDTAGTGNWAVVSIGESANPSHRLVMLRTTSQIAAQSVGSADVRAATLTGTITTNTLYHVATVFSSTTLRDVYLDGVAGVTNTQTSTVNTLNELLVGARRSGASAGLFHDGIVAELGIWNVALTAAEIASLADGMTCDKVRPQSLVFYAPLVRDLQDVRGGLTITNNGGATVANHPRVYA
jgi:hypothetical protein